MRNKRSFVLPVFYIITILIALIVPVSCRGCHKAVADYSGDVDEIWQVQGDAAKRISDYEWFEGKYQSIKNECINATIYLSKNEDVTDQIVIINRWIAEYNARSREYTRSMWKEESLPHQIEPIRSTEDLNNF
jgi:hypothetical protein